MPARLHSFMNPTTTDNSASSPRVRKLRVFVVENHPDTSYGLKMILEALGYEFILAQDLKSALKLADEIEFDVLLSDIGLPDSDGWTLMRALRQKRRVAGIAMSGYGMREDLDRSKAAGFLEHLVKPMSGDDLERAIKHAAETKSRWDAELTPAAAPLSGS